MPKGYHMSRNQLRDYWQREAGFAELLQLAFPLILSNSIWTIQVTVDRLLLSRYSLEAMEATLPTVALFWTPVVLLQGTAGYAATFVSQYVGAGRPNRVGPSVWQALYFAVAAGLAFLLFWPLAAPIMALGGHSPAVQEQEVVYFRCLCFAALPMTILAAANSFFTGRGKTWTVLFVEGIGIAVNGVVGYGLIFGELGLPELGIAGAGWAMVIGMSVSALLGLFLVLQAENEKEFCTRSGWRFDDELFRRLMYYGVPSGLQIAMDILAFTVFLFLLGRFGDAELAASNIAFSINTVAVLPMLGISQAVMVSVGRRLGEDRPELAERSAWAGFWIAWVFMAAVGLSYFLSPGFYVAWFRNEKAANWTEVAALVPVLLRFVAVYCSFDSMTLVFSFALRGAGDTRFVTVLYIILAWPIMVLPTWAAHEFGWGLYWAWVFATAYVIALALCFLARFRYGRWKTMRVIEPVAVANAKTEDGAAEDAVNLCLQDGHS
jgi:MATE family multidrug resistance protein